MGVFNTECAERRVLEPGFGNKGDRFGLSCTLECRLLEPVSFWPFGQPFRRAIRREFLDVEYIYNMVTIGLCWKLLDSLA